MSYSIISFVAIITTMSSVVLADNSLYDERVDQVVVVSGKTNFAKAVYNSPRASLVVFYAPWSGPCQEIKPKIVVLAHQTRAWHSTVVRVIVVNCSDSANNNDVCRKENVPAYPTLRLYGPRQTSLSNNQTYLVIKHKNRSLEVILHDIIDFLHDKFHSPNLKNFKYNIV